jgi:hypothetical protein
MLISETVIWDMLTNAPHSGFPRHGRHGQCRLEVPSGHGHAEVDPAAAADDAINITRFEEVADHHLGARGP